MSSLLEHLDLLQVDCLNERHDHDLRSLVSARKINDNDSPLYLESDADAQLLLTLTFNQAVRIRQLVIRSKVPDSGPKVLKLRVNKPTIGFSDVEYVPDNTFDQVIVLSREDVELGKCIPLRFVRFQFVNSLHIFVESSQDGGNTRIDALDVLGVPVEATKDLSGLRREEE